MDLISVIVPVYNVKNYLKKCVDSILSQTYSVLQVILVDDGSTDGSGELCDLLAKCDKFKLFTNQTVDSQMQEMQE